MTPEAFRLRLAKDCAVAPGSHVLAAVSGGADSTALLCFFARMRGEYAVSCAHVEHGVRGEASLEDMAFVRALCEKENIPFYAERVDAPGYARAHGCGLEEAARTLRYDFLVRTADAVGADVIALAHHAGDQAETVLLHAVRGSDVRGLCAMRMRRGRFIRPLLDCAPQELRAYLTAIGQPWREDGTNADERYARNRIRRSVMPQLERVSAGAGAALCRLAAASQRDEDYFDRQLDALNLRFLPLVDGAAAERAALGALHPALLSRALVRLLGAARIAPQNAQVIGAVMDALVRGDGAVNLTGGAHVLCGARYLCALRADTPAVDVPLDGGGETPFGAFSVRPAAPGETGDGVTAQAIPARLLERARWTNRRAGDVLIPFGRREPVKIKKLMIDAGVERGLRASVPLLRTPQGEVLWAVGLRPADACRGGPGEARMIVERSGAGPAITSIQEESI